MHARWYRVTPPLTVWRHVRWFDMGGQGSYAGSTGGLRQSAGYEVRYGVYIIRDIRCAVLPISQTASHASTACFVWVRARGAVGTCS